MNVHFKEISAWISAAVIVVLYGYYVSQAPAAASQLDALRLYIMVAVLFVIAEVVLHVVAAIIHRPEKEDERDKLVGARASRNASYVLMTGITIAIFQLLMPIVLFAKFLHMPSGTFAVHILVLTAAIAELVRFVSQIAYYRRGA